MIIYYFIWLGFFQFLCLKYNLNKKYENKKTTPIAIFASDIKKKIIDTIKTYLPIFLLPPRR